MNLTIDVEEMLWQSITMIESQDMLIAMKTADFPHLKKENRSRVHKSIYKNAFPKVFENTEPMDNEKLAKFIGRNING